MIRVTIEMIPRGQEAAKRHLGTIEIANEGNGTETSGNYKARLAPRGRPQQTWRSALVTYFPRKSLGPYDLLLRALVAAVGTRNKRIVAILDSEVSLQSVAELESASAITESCELDHA